MKLKKFFGPTSRSVLAQIRAELGADAVIVANRSTAQGIELTAVAGNAMDTMLGDRPRAAASAGSPAVPAAVSAAPPAAGDSSSQRAGGPVIASKIATTAKASAIAMTAPEAPSTAPVPGATASAAGAPAATAPAAIVSSFVPTWIASTLATTVRMESPALAAISGTMVSSSPSAPPSALGAPASADPDVGLPPPHEDRSTVANARLMQEMAAMRALLEDHVEHMTWSDSVRRQPLRARFTRDLLACGFSALLAREITQRLPDDYGYPQAQQWLLRVLSRNLPCIAAEDDPISRGGVYALVGPTGVGKTTTTAKLAARCAVRHGSASLALISTDSYRVGAHDQLRIYAKILGVNVHSANDTEDLGRLLETLSSRHLVLIDTVGMGQRDSRLAEQADLLAQPGVRRLIMLNAAAEAETLDEVANAYRGSTAEEHSSVAGCIITKLDEAARPGHALDVAIRHHLVLHYVSNGQRVPEDLQSANPAYLVHRALKAANAPSPFKLRDREFALLTDESAEALRV